MSDLPPSQTSSEATDTVHIAAQGGPWVPREAADPAPLPRGAAIGRYLVLDLIGRGGMGMVYSGYDPELDRKVALKLLRPDRAGSGGERYRARLLREAQAIARLSHPNVVAVYDAGTFDDRVFVAMELVEGQTLRQWLGEERRSWQEVLAVLLPAGRGLAAAHAAGLVHRDFKPENVLLGRDGRARVADFGLARQAGRLDDEAEEPPAAEVSPLTAPLTGWGMAVGTPAYMAPEQLRGEPADPCSDQYAFCLTLWEALHGERPFTEAGALRDPAGSRVPARLRQVVLRGLSADPAARWPSMEDLLAVLERDPSAVRRRGLAAAAALALAAAAGLGFFEVQRRESLLCQGAPAKLAGVWDLARKEAARAAFLHTGLPNAPAAWAGIEQSLDRYAVRWASAHREACEATRVRGEQSEALLDRRMLCLDERLAELGAVADLLSHADARVVRDAFPAMRALQGVAECASREVLLQRVPPPRDPRVRSRVAEVRSRLAEARAQQAAGRLGPALAAAALIERRAAALPYRPLQAEALFLLGDIYENTGDFPRAEKVLYEALAAADQSRDDLLRARAWKKLAYLVGYRMGRYDEGIRVAGQARAALARTGRHPGLEASILNAEATILVVQGRYRDALSRIERAMSQAGSLDPDDPDLDAMLSNLGTCYRGLGHMERALAAYRKALERAQRRLGGLHPDTAAMRMNLGIALNDLGRFQEAESELQSALAVRAKLLGPDHPDLAESLLALADLWGKTGRAGRGIPLLRRAVAIYEKTLSPDNPMMAMAWNNLADALRKVHGYDEALILLQKALASLERSQAPGLYIAIVLQGIGEVYLARRQPSAVSFLERAAAMMEREEAPADWISEVRFKLDEARSIAGRSETQLASLPRE